MSKKRKYDVFISYPHSESDWARKFACALKDRHTSVWIDRDQVKPGQSLAKAVQDGLKSSDTVVIVFPPENATNPGVLFELGAAVAMGKHVIPIIPADMDPAKIPFSLQLRRFIRRGHPEETAAELLAKPAEIA